MRGVIRALRVLEELSGVGEGLTLQDLAQRLDMPPSTMHRLLGFLVEEQFVVRSPVGPRYHLGPRAWTLSARATSQELCRVAEPRLAAAAAEIGHTVFLSELRNGRVVCAVFCEGSRAVRLSVRVGQEIPLHAASSARVLLASLGEDDARGLLEGYPLKALRDATPTTVDELMQRLQEVRQRGYDICDDEMDEEVWAVSAPVRGVDGTVCAAVTVAAPAAQLEDADARLAAREMTMRTAASISGTLGYGPAAARDEQDRGPGDRAARAKESRA